MAPKQVVVANWKMHKTDKESLLFIDQFAPLLSDNEAYIAAPFTSLPALVTHETSMLIKIGAQNMSEHREGAFTGEISVGMLKALGVQFVILGHSERRHVFGESDAQIRAKLVLALEEDMPVILCIGENLEEREEGQTESVLARQLESALHGLKENQLKNLMIAYEPVWAIGTGRAATPQMANEAHQYCRKFLTEIIGKNFAQSLTILYGGSVKPENAQELKSEEHIDGFLVGGASLEPKSFAKIITS